MSEELSATTRRTVLKGTGVAALAGIVPAVASGSGSDWQAVESPTEETLHGVEYTADGAYTVGESGVLLARTARGWRKLLDGGPTGNGNDLYGAGVTDDGRRLWFVGASGAIGEYDVEAGVLYDHSAPNDQTNNFNDVAVTGPAGDANVYVADDSGLVHYSFENGEEGTWEYVTPGSGSAISGIDFHDARSGHLADTNGQVFATDDGATWEAIGIEDAGEQFLGLDSDAEDDVCVVGDGGTAFRYDGAAWTPTDVGDAPLQDVEVKGDGQAVGGGGAAFAYDGTWRAEATPTGANLKAVALGDPAIAVGASGTILEQ